MLADPLEVVMFLLEFVGMCRNLVGMLADPLLVVGCCGILVGLDLNFVGLLADLLEVVSFLLVLEESLLVGRGTSLIWMDMLLVCRLTLWRSYVLVVVLWKSCCFVLGISLVWLDALLV